MTDAFSPDVLDASFGEDRARAPALEFAAIYTTWFGVVHRWVQALGGRATDVEDLTQEVFVVVQRQLPRFDGQNLAGWLYRITQRTVRDHRRSSWFRRVLTGQRRELAEDLVDEVATSSEQLERKQDRERFYRIVDRMNPKWRETFVLFEVVGHSGDDIASLLAVPPATVRTHLHRARKEFLALVAKESQS